ncbi:MAG: hypothetical protein V4510_09335 [bacterium]
MRAAAGLCVVAALLVAGCSGGSSPTLDRTLPGAAHISGSGFSTNVQTDHVQCAAHGHMDVHTNGFGTLTVDLRDASGRLVFTVTTVNQGETTRHEDVNGTAGVWTLTVDPGAPHYQGDFDVKLDCKV